MWLSLWKLSSYAESQKFANLIYPRMPFDYSVCQMKAKRQTKKNTEVFAVLFL